jgi:hypothetical protein
MNSVSKPNKVNALEDLQNPRLKSQSANGRFDFPPTVASYKLEAYDSNPI